MSTVMTRDRTRKHETHSDYAAAPGVNWSCLKAMQRSPAHYQYRLTHPLEDTPAMRFGRAVHCAVLEPDRFPLDFTTFAGRRAGNAWAEFAAVNGDKTILTVEDYERALDVRDAVRAHRVARRLLRWGKPEVSLQWVDPETRVRCKGRLDWLAPGGVLVDLKTTRDIEARTFGRLAERMSYHCQAAFYRSGLIASGAAPAAVYMIAVEVDEPHDVAAYAVDEDVLEVGLMEVRALLHRVKECRRKRRWPGGYPEVESLDFPQWALASDNDLSGLGIAFQPAGGIAS